MQQFPQGGGPQQGIPGVSGGQEGRPRRRTWWYWVGGIVMAVALCCGGGTLATLATGHTSPGDNGQAQTTTQQSSTTTSASVPAAKPTATHVAQWTTVQKFSGTTSQKTPLFTVPNEWRIVWTCQKADQFGGNFVVSVMNADGSPMDFAVVNTQDNDEATTYEHQGGGQVYLDIETYSEQWTVEVQVQQ